ncbi:hypothetical protein BB560_006517 [Smittium megazygosporum]|uniref:Uncharacterized protein n=1 Tax=Smittium megazygosporum TaxID=133381 RepID=A0A2T9Y4N4_9FUNG|nr:hypothetical protein BB560_006517 [Smittium megazygosporum]
MNHEGRPNCNPEIEDPLLSSIEFWCMGSPSANSYRESQTAIPGLGRKVG